MITEIYFITLIDNNPELSAYVYQILIIIIHNSLSIISE